MHILKILTGFILASVLSISILAAESEVTYLVNQGPYISEYARVCDTAVVLNDVAQTRCANRGNGWHFGTIPTKASLDGAWNATKYLSTFIDFVWFASSDAVTEGTWLHSAGRVTGKLFWIGVANGTCYTWYFDTFDGPVGVKYCPWDPAQPENAGNGLSTGADCAAFWGSAASSKLFTGDTYCNRSDFKCYLCERSRCNYTVDCFRPNTLDMVGDYWPNCTCICKPGAYGSKCQYPLVVDHGPYVSEYNFTCQATNILSAAAQAKCQGIGREWNLATFPSAGSLTKMWKQMYSPVYGVKTNYWIGISDAATEGTWLWNTGRAKGGHFWTGLANGVCETWALNSFYADYPNYFCPWASYQPENIYGSNEADCGIMWWGDDTHGTYEMADTYCLRADIKCYACERSPCQLGLDCFRPNTINMTGQYYPNCNCTCKPGTNGTRCELVDNGPYMSEYTRTCDASPLISSAAQTKCRLLGPEWNLATFPTPQSYSTFGQQTVYGDSPGGTTWSGSNDSALEGTWVWSHGRLAGKNFWTGLANGVCKTYWYGPAWANTSFKFCQFNETQPENASPSTAGGAQCGGVWYNGTALVMGDTWCTRRTDIYCYACERSACNINVDCMPDNTASVAGYFPSCNCTCKFGASGSMCENVTTTTSTTSTTTTTTSTTTTTTNTTVSSTTSASTSTTFTSDMPTTVGPTTVSETSTETEEPTKDRANCSIGDICQLVMVAHDQLALFDTCTEPDLSETTAKNSTYVPLAKYIGNAAKQAAIQSSYIGPALPSGNPFYYGSVGVLWSEGMAKVTHVAAASRYIAACWMYPRGLNGTEIIVSVEALTVAADSVLDSASVPVVVMVLSLNVSCGAAVVVFNRTVAMERPVVYLPKKAFVPDNAVRDTATTTGALSVTVGAVAVPIAAMQQGVALALLRMAQCEQDALNGEPLDVSVHPLQFGLGGGSGKYGRGALVGNLLVVPAIWCTLMYLLVPFAIRALTDRTLDASRDFVGWPGMAPMPLAVLSEGSTMASVGLLTQGSVGDIIMGLIGLAFLLVATACWAVELWRMRRQVVLRRASVVVSWLKAIHPRFEWEVCKKIHDGNTVAIDSYLDKRIQLVGSSWWLWSALAAHVLSMVVGVAESLPVSSSMCRVRWAVASLAAVLQAAAVMTTTVPVELLLLGVIGALSCILVVLIALSTFDVVTPGSTFSALNTVGMVNSVLGIALLGIGVCATAYDIFAERSRRALSARMGSQGPATPLSILNVPMIPQQQASAPPVITFPPSSEELEELAIEVPQLGRSSRYPDMPAHWVSFLDDIDLAVRERELAASRSVLLENR